MLFINFLCLLYLMVLSNGHTISKSINNKNKIDEVSHAVTSVHPTKNDQTRHDRSSYDNYRQTFRRENKNPKLLDQQKVTKVLIVPPKNIDTTSPKTTTDHVKYKSQKKKAGGFWRKFRGKDNKINAKRNTECKYTKNRETSIHNTREYGWWKHTERREAEDSDPKKIKRKNRYMFVLRKPGNSFAKRDVKSGVNKKQKTLTHLQIGIAPHMVSPSLNRSFKNFKPIVKTHTMKMSTNNVSNVTKADITSTKLNSPTTNDNDYSFNENISDMLARITSQVNNLKKMYNMVKSTTVPITKQTSSEPDYTQILPDFTGTAQIEELLRDIKVKAMEMVAESMPSVSELIQNTVTETTFNSDPILHHLHLFTLGFFVNDNKVYKPSINKNSYQEVAENASLESDKSDPHNIVTRSFKDDSLTIAHNVEDMLQREIEYIYKKVKSKVSNEYCKGKKKASKVLQSTTKKILEEIKKIGTKPKPKCTTPKHTNKQTTVSRYSRGTKNTKEKDDLPKHTATYDDYFMLTLYEQMLKKTHQNNLMKMLATADIPVQKRWPGQRSVSKRSPDIQMEVKLKEDQGKYYEGVSTSSDFNYVDTSNTEQNTEATAISFDINEPSFTGSYDGFDQITYDNLSSKISYNDYVNGYKHYLKFQQDQANQNFSSLVKYQAHRHHNVDDIGKYILDKIPQLPNLSPETGQQRYKRFFDDSDLDDQDISTKNDDSWFKKHFYFFIDSGPPKKFHTSQTVSLKSPVAGSCPGQKPTRRADSGIRERVSFHINGNNITSSVTTSYDNVHLTNVLEGMKQPKTLYNLRRPLFYTVKTTKKVDAMSNSTYNEMEQRDPINFVYKIGNKRRRELLTTSINDLVTDLANRFKRHNASSIDDLITKEITNNATTKFKRNLTPITQTKTKPKPKNKVGYLDINLIPRQTAIVQVGANSTKRSKFREFFKKFYKNKEKKKTKRSNASRLPRFNPFKTFKDIFKVKSNDKNAPNLPRAKQQNLSDYEIVNTHIDTFKPIKYVKIPNPLDMQKQIPNISDTYYGDIEVLLNRKTSRFISTKQSTFLLKQDDDLFSTEKKTSVSSYDHNFNMMMPYITTASISPIYAFPTLFKDHSEVMSVTVKNLTPDTPSHKSEQHITPKTTYSSMRLSNLNIDMSGIQFKLMMTKAFPKETTYWNKRAGNKKTTLSYSQRYSEPLFLTRKPIEELTIDRKMTRVAKFPISHMKSLPDTMETVINNNYINAEDAPMSSNYLHESVEQSAASTELSVASKGLNIANKDSNLPSAIQKTVLPKRNPAATYPIGALQNAYKKPEKMKQYIKVNVQKTERQPNRNIYVHYLNDLLMWRKDILNLDKASNMCWANINSKRHRFTTSNVNNLLSGFKDINQFLDKNRSNTYVNNANNPSPRNIAQEYETKEFIKSIGLNDKAIVSTKDFLIEGEAKYYLYNRPTKGYDTIIERQATKTSNRPIILSKHLSWAPSGYGIGTPEKGVYKTPFQFVSSMAHRYIPTTEVNLLSLQGTEKPYSKNMSPIIEKPVAEEETAWDTERITNWAPEQSFTWYARKPVSWVNRFSTSDPERTTTWKDTDRLATWDPADVTAWNAEKPKVVNAMMPRFWDQEIISNIDAAKPLRWEKMTTRNWNEEQPPNWNAEQPSNWHAELATNWNVEQPLNWDAIQPPDSSAVLSIDLNTARSEHWAPKSSTTWSAERYALDERKSNLSLEVPNLSKAGLSQFFSTNVPLVWAEEKPSTLSTAQATTKRSKAIKYSFDGPIIWSSKGPVESWTAKGGVTTNIFSIADIYYREKLRTGHRKLQRYGRLPTRTYTRPFYSVKGVKRESGQKEAPADMIDTTLLSYDDEVETVKKVLNLKMRNLDKTAKCSKSDSIKNQRVKSTEAPIKHLHKHPIQYYTTPLPMKPIVFDKFLKEQGIDVEYVTSPIYEQSTTLNSYKHHQTTILNIKQLMGLKSMRKKFKIKGNDKLNIKGKMNTKNIVKSEGKKKKSKEVMQFSQMCNTNNLTSTTKALTTKPTIKANSTKAHSIDKNAKRSNQLNDDFYRKKRYSEYRYNIGAYPHLNEIELYLNYGDIVKKATKDKDDTPVTITTQYRKAEKEIENKTEIQPELHSAMLTKMNIKNKAELETDKGDSEVPHYKDVEITIINFEDKNKIKKSDVADTSPFDLDFSREPRTKHLHNKMLYKNLKEVNFQPIEDSNITGTTHSYVFREHTEPHGINKPFDILYNLRRLHKNQHRVHISNHQYEYDIYFDSEKKHYALSDARHLHKLSTVSPLAAMSLSALSKPPSYTNKSTTDKPTPTVNWQSKRAVKQNEEEGGFAIKFGSSKLIKFGGAASNCSRKKYPQNSLPALDRQDTTYTIADSFKMRPLGRKYTKFDEIKNFNAATAFRQNAESANLLAASEKCEPIEQVIHDNTFDDKYSIKSEDSFRKFIGTLNPDNFNYMNKQLDAYNPLDKTLFKLVLSDKGQKYTTAPNVIIFFNTSETNFASKVNDPSQPKKVFFKIIDDNINDVGRQDESFFRRVSSKPNTVKKMQTKPTLRLLSNAPVMAANADTTTEVFLKFVDSDDLYGGFDLFKFNSSNEYNNINNNNCTKPEESSSSWPNFNIITKGEGFIKYFGSDEPISVKSQHNKPEQKVAKFISSDNVSNKPGSCKTAREKSYIKNLNDNKFFKALKSQKASQKTSTKVYEYEIVNNNAKSQTNSEGLFKLISPDKVTPIKIFYHTDLGEGFIKCITPEEYKEYLKSQTKSQEMVSGTFNTKSAEKSSKAEKEEQDMRVVDPKQDNAGEKYDMSAKPSPETTQLDDYEFAIISNHSDILGHHGLFSPDVDSNVESDFIKTSTDAPFKVTHLYETVSIPNQFEDWDWPIDIPVKEKPYTEQKMYTPRSTYTPSIKMYQPEIEPPNLYEQSASKLQIENPRIAFPLKYQPPLEPHMIQTTKTRFETSKARSQTPTTRIQTYDPLPVYDSRSSLADLLPDQPLKDAPKFRPWLPLPLTDSWLPTSSTYSTLEDKSWKSTEEDRIEDIYLEDNDADEQNYYDLFREESDRDLLHVTEDVNEFIEKDPPVLKNRKIRDATMNSSNGVNDKDLFNRKKAVRSEVTYTAKNVAALEVIVDLMKNTLSYEEKDIANVFNAPMRVDNAMKSICQPLDSTSSIQAHIAIPYDTQNGKKRSPLEPVRVRKVFSAKMFTPVDLEYQVHSFENTFENTGSFCTIDDGLSPGIYLLVGKSKNGYALKPVAAKTGVKLRQASTTPAQLKEETTRREDIRNYTKVTLSKNFIAAVNKQLIELYENLTKISTRETFARKKRDADCPTTSSQKITPGIEKGINAEDERYRIKKKIDWEAIKKFFGHDRVCNCKCKENKTMCRACAASDAVIDELIFEFDNLGQFMQDHCTEIQTYFWMNPSGGLKLRNAVNRIDKSLNDYYKRVKGKCKGRPCERFNIYIDKRQFVKTAKVVKEAVLGDLINDLAAIAEDVNQICEMRPCFNPKFKERGDSMTASMRNCIALKNFTKRYNNLVTKNLLKNVYSLDNINVNIICKPENQVVGNYEATALSSSQSLPTSSPHDYKNFTFDVDDSHHKYKKRKGFKHLFSWKKKNDQFFSSYTIPNQKPKIWIKRDTRNQIELPLIADSGGSFWFDYLNGASTNEPRVARQTFKQNNIQKFNEVLQTKYLFTKKVEDDKARIDINKMYITVRTNSKNDYEEIETDSDLFTTDSFTHNINQLFELFGNFSDIENMNMNSNRSKMFLKHTTKQVVKMKPATPQNTTKDSPQLPNINNSPYASIKGSHTKLTTTKTTELNKVESLKHSLEDLEKKIEKVSKSGITIRTISGETPASMITKSDKATKYTSTLSSPTITQKTRTNKVSTTTATKTYTSETVGSEMPKVDTQPVTESSTETVTTTTTDKPLTLPTYTTKTKDSFLACLKAATLKYLKKIKKTTKARRYTNANEDTIDIGESGVYINEIDNLRRRTTNDNPTVVIINEYDSQFADDIRHQHNKHSDDYKNLLLSIIQYETNKLNSEWQKIVYGSEREVDDIYKRSLAPDKEKTLAAALDTLVPKLKQITTMNQDNTVAPLGAAPGPSKKGILISISDLKLPDPTPSSKTPEPSKKPSGLLNKIVNKINMKVASAANKKNEKAVKQSYLRDVKQKCNKKRTTKTTQDPAITEASDTYLPSSSICDLQATFDRVKKLSKEMVEAKFEEYVKDIPCYKYQRLNRSFFINYRSGAMKWDWIRNKRSIVHVSRIRNGRENLDDGEPNYDGFETFVKGDDNIYRFSNREKRNVKAAVNFPMQWLPSKASENEIYVMLGDSTILNCLPYSRRSRLIEPQPQYSWQTDRKDMLEHDNLQVDGYKLVIWKAGPKNSGRYSCSLDNSLVKVINVNVVTLPAFDIVFLPTYRVRQECTYEDLRAIQHLGRVMTKQASCGTVCSIRIDEPMCQRDRVTNRSMIRSTAVLTMCPWRIKCSVQCRQNLMSSLVRLAAANVPALTNNEVVISKNGVNETLRPCVDTGRPMITHTLRKIDSGGHHEYHKLSSLIEPGKMHVVIICHAGYYLLRDQRLCAPCSYNTSSTIGDNTCTPCPQGTVSEPGASKCHAIDNRPRRYDWWWYPPCGYMAAFAVVVGACGLCVALSLIMHVLSRAGHARCDRLSSTSQQRIAKTISHVVQERYVHTSRARPLSPSRVILARFFRPSLTSSRCTGADSQETRFEQWKEKNIPPPLPPIDFDIDTS